MRGISFIEKLVGNLLLTLFFFISGCSRQNNDALSEQYHYDSEGRLIAKTNPDGKTTHYNYNDRGLLTEIIYPESRVQYGYDKNGNRIWMQDPTGMTEYYYDAFDRLIGVISKHSPWRLIWYDYDSWGYLRYMAILNLQMLEQELKYRNFLQALQQDLSLRQQKWPEYQFKLSEMLSRLQQESVEAKQRWFEYEVKYN